MSREALRCYQEALKHLSLAMSFMLEAELQADDGDEDVEPVASRRASSEGLAEIADRLRPIPQGRTEA